MGQPRQPDGEWTPIEDAKQAAGIILLLVQVFASLGEVLMRKRFGKKALGVPAFLALFAILLWPAFVWPGEDPRPIMVLWVVYVVFLIRARIEGIVMSVRGERVHSRYIGDSRLLPWLGRWFAPNTIKGEIDCVILILVGAILMQTVSESLGSFVIVSALCMVGHLTSIVSLEKARAEQLYDSWLEQQQQAEAFREMQDRYGQR